MKVLNPVLVFVSVPLVYLAVGGFGLINLDDYIYLTDRADVYGWEWAFTWVGDAMWTPLTWISYWLDSVLFGECWSVYHWENVFIHGLCGVVLYGVLRSLWRDVPRLWPLIGALLWALHPLRVESVAWLASRKDALSTFFFVSALWFWVNSGEKAGLAVSLLLVAVGGLAKSSVMVFPAFVFAIDFFIVRRAKPWLAYLVAVLLAVGFGLVAVWAQGAGGADYVTRGISIEYRILNAFCAITIYLFNLVCPTQLAAQCLLKYPGVPRFSLVGFAVLCGVVWYLYGYVRKVDRLQTFPKDGAVAGIVVFFAALVPFLGLSGFGGHAFADRFTILPSLGLSLLFMEMAARFERGAFPQLSRVQAAAVCLVAVGALSALTVRQVSYWKDDGTLFRRTLEVDGADNLLAHEELIMHHYEVDHDFELIYPHAVQVFGGPDWQQRSMAHVGPILLEAAYETGHLAEARKIYDWHQRWAKDVVRDLRRENPMIGQTDTMQVAEAIRCAYEDETLKDARKIRDKLKDIYPENFMVKNLDVILARRSGDRQAYEKAWRAAYAPSGEAYLKNRWATALPVR